MQYHEVKLNIQLADSTEIAGIASDTISVVPYVDYVYLDTDERRRFAQVSHEYLITQLQFTGDESVSIAATERSQNVRLNFNHPVRFLAWVARGSTYGRFTGAPVDAANVANLNSYAESLAPLKSAKLQLNGHDRFSERKGSYFNLVQPFQTLKARVPAGVYMYSFALKPDELQPSGTCNLSRIDVATLNLTWKAANKTGNLIANVDTEDVTVAAATDLSALKVFAENYNVLRIMSGMGGLAYSN